MKLCLNIPKSALQIQSLLKGISNKLRFVIGFNEFTKCRHPKINVGRTNLYIHLYTDRIGTTGYGFLIIMTVHLDFICMVLFNSPRRLILLIK